jgi:hypothetical protein
MNSSPQDRSASSGYSSGLVTLLVILFVLFVLFADPFFFGRINRNQARRAQAKSDCAQITTAIKAYYDEYGKYPLGGHGVSDGQKPGGFIFGQSPNSPTIGSGISNAELFVILRNIDSPSATPQRQGQPNFYNPRGIVFFDGKMTIDSAPAGSGFVPPDAKAPAHPGAFVDPWGTEYFIVISSSSTPQLMNLPYKDLQNANAPRVNVGVFSFGKDQRLGTKGDGFYKNPSTSAVSDDIISWQ